MSWGTELWDQYENIAIHTQKGLDFCEKYIHFIKERCAIERDYASRLRKLYKSYTPKKKDEESESFTYAKGFQDMIKEINDIAGQHDRIAEDMTNSIVKDINLVLQDVKLDRKKSLQEGQKQMTTLSNQLSALERSKKQYEKAFRDSEKAQEAHKKADADINLSRAEVEKARITSVNRQQLCEQCKNEYALELQKTNQGQREHYTTIMPRIFQNLEEMEKRRILRVQNSFRQCAEIERSVIPILNTCIQEIIKAAESIDPDEDNRMVVVKNTSGLHPPGDIPFDDLGSMHSGENHNSSTPVPKSVRSDTMKGTLSGGKTKKRGGLFGIFSHPKQTDDTKEDFSHLPPMQQKRNLQQRIDSLRMQKDKETSARDALLKMKDVYEQNNALGDPQSLKGQLEENAQKLDKLSRDIAKFEGYLAGTNATLNQQQSNHTNSNESLTKSVSEMSVTDNSLPSTPQQHHRTAPIESPESDSSAMRTSFQEEGSFDDDLDEEEEEEFTVIGLCRALYQFEAQSEGAIGMDEGESLEVLETDQGDGWTRVRRPSTGEEGFVPTSYINIQYET